MLKFYFHTTPNPRKVALLLEEIGTPYEVVPIDTRNGEQHSPEFLKINPNAKTPAIDDHGTVVFDSNAILLYLAEKHGKFLGAPAQRGELLSWLMFVATGLGPFMGQAVHFGRAAPEPVPYAINRYRREAERHWRVIDAKIGANPYVLGGEYTIVDMALWGWTRPITYALGDDVTIERFPNVARWFAGVDARPAAQRAMKVGADIPFKTVIDEEAKRFLYPSNY